MSPYVIRNPVPTPEEMAEILGLSAERVNVLRRIMSESPRRKKLGNGGRRVEGARKKSPAARRANR